MKISFILVLVLFSIQGCLFFKGGQYGSDFAIENELEDYEIIDASGKRSLTLTVYKDKKVAILVDTDKNSSRKWLYPEYMNSIVNYEGSEDCCRDAKTHRLNATKKVFLFSFNGKGKTSIKLIMRLRRLDSTKRQTLEGDEEFQAHFNIK